MTIGFGREDEPPTRERTKYDSFLYKDVRVDVGGGIRGVGRLEECERSGHGYSFKLRPAVVFEPDGTPRKEEGEYIPLDSNGNPFSIFPVGDLDAYIREITPKKKKVSQRN